MALLLENLPTETILNILTFLDVKDVLNVGLTCKTFYQVTSMESVWQRLTKEEYPCLSKREWGEDATFYNIFSKVLHPYRGCEGLWGNSVSPYGVFVHVKMEGGKFVARFSKLPQSFSLDEPLEWNEQPIFTLSLVDGKTQLTCCRKCPECPATLKIQKDSIHFECHKCQAYCETKNVSDCYLDFKDRDTRQNSDKVFHALHAVNFWTAYSLYRITPIIQSSASPIRLGIFKGTYGAHGIELINFHLAPNGCEIIGKKILGDPNVPAGEISLTIDLCQPVIRTEAGADDLDKLVPHSLSEPYRFPADHADPFSPPVNMSREINHRIPNTCRGRYVAKGQIAGSGFWSPRQSPTWFIVFSDETFGVWWQELMCFSLFKRLTDDLS